MCTDVYGDIRFDCGWNDTCVEPDAMYENEHDFQGNETEPNGIVTVINATQESEEKIFEKAFFGIFISKRKKSFFQIATYSRFPQIVRFFCVDFLAKRTICGISGQKNGQSLDIFSLFWSKFYMLTAFRKLFLLKIAFTSE